MRLVCGLCMVLVALTVGPLAAQDAPVSIQNGFITGLQFRDLMPNQKRTYTMGVVDGLFLAPLFGAPESGVLWLRECVVGMTDEQISMIVSRFLERHPERWHESMHGIVYGAMRDACPRRQPEREAKESGNSRVGGAA